MSPTDHAPQCDDEGCYCSDDAFWGRLLGDDDPCAPGKDWVAAAFGMEPEREEPKCEGLAPFHCGNPSCPAHADQGEGS